MPRSFSVSYLSAIRRSKGLVLAVAIAVPALTLLFSFTESPTYEANADVLLAQQDLASSLTGLQQASSPSQPDRAAETQARLARVPAVATLALQIAGLPDRTVKDFLEDSSAEPQTNADLLRFSVTESSRERATGLATAYAQAFTQYRAELDASVIDRVAEQVRAQLADLREGGTTEGDLYTTLLEREQQLTGLSALTATSFVVVREASESSQVGPKPLRNAVLGALLGLLVGVGLAVARDALDNRVRDLEEIIEELNLPLLGRIPPLSGRPGPDGRPVMLADPAGPGSEPFRMLKTNLEFLALTNPVKSIMLTSAVEGEGKSSTAANLSVALARSGARVALVDLDLRRPNVHRLMQVPPQPGVTEVALRQLPLAAALRTIPLEPRTASDVGGNGSRIEPPAAGGSLWVLPCGLLPSNAGEFAASVQLANTLLELAPQVDFIIVDAPPLLAVSDALTISRFVDSVIFVVDPARLSRPMLRNVARLFGMVPAEKLGLVATGKESEDSTVSYGYGGDPRRTDDAAELRS